MSNLEYIKESDPSKDYYTLKEYKVKSRYQHRQLHQAFLQLKANVVDLNSSMVVKCLQGTERDFLMLMNRAKDFLNDTTTININDKGKTVLLQMFQDCVFGYYVLTPLMEDEMVSDIKVLSWNHIVCKIKGDRYITNLSFENEHDYNSWFERILRIYNLILTNDAPLQQCTDRKGNKENFLRVDTQNAYIVSTENNNIHFRKIPKVKREWSYLKDAGMIDNEMEDYIKDRVQAGYNFLLSGRGGSGKTSLLNNMIDSIPFSESVLIGQENDELYSNIHPQMQIERTIRGYDEKGRPYDVINLEDILRLGLLQDIDNFIIGEIKGGEALYCFTTAMSTGARFMATIHSNTARDSTNRLAYCARYISDYSVETLLEILSQLKFSLIHLSQFSVDEIVEIGGWNVTDHTLIFKDIYRKEVRL